MYIYRSYFLNTLHKQTRAPSHLSVKSPPQQKTTKDQKPSPPHRPVVRPRLPTVRWSWATQVLHEEPPFFSQA